MLPELSSLLSGTRAAYDIAKGIGSLKAEVQRNEAISKILEVLLSVQTEALSVNAIAQELQEEKHALAKRVMECEKWSEIEQQYALTEIVPGVFVYAYKPSEDATKPLHWLCPKCYQDRQAHILQFRNEDGVGKRYFCPNCSTELVLKHNQTSRSTGYVTTRSCGPGSWMG